MKSAHPFLRAKIIGICAVGARDFRNYLVNDNGYGLVVAENISYRLLSGGGVDVCALNLNIGLHLLDRALELADIVLELLRYVFYDVVAYVKIECVGLALDYEHTRLEIRRLNVGEQTPLEAGAHSVLKLRHILGRTVGREDDLLAVLRQSVEGVENSSCVRSLLAIN